jgi:hypothetical protein
MTGAENIIERIIEGLPNASKGKMFGAVCIKSSVGKTTAFLWKGNMVFKLDKKSRGEALSLDGAKIGSHIYAPDREMKEWVSIPEKHSDTWRKFALAAMNYVEHLK